MSVLWLSLFGLQNTPTASLQRGKTSPISILWPSQLELQNTPTASLQRDKTSPMSVLDMTLNYLMVELWGMQSTPLLSSLPGSLWSGVVAPDRVLSMGQTELNCVLMLN